MKLKQNGTTQIASSSDALKIVCRAKNLNEVIKNLINNQKGGTNENDKPK